jgi:hypothetical protein
MEFFCHAQELNKEDLRKLEDHTYTYTLVLVALSIQDYYHRDT